MKRIAIAVLFVAFVILFASTAATQAQTGGSITINKNGSPASGVSFVLDLSNRGKVGTSTTGTTDSGGHPSNVLDLSNLGKAHYDVYEKTCVNGETVVVIVPAGQQPTDTSCKHRRIGGFDWWGDGGDHVIIDTGTHTVSNPHGSIGTGTHIVPSNFHPYQVFGGYNFYHETNQHFNGGTGSFAYSPKPCWAVVGDFAVDHWSDDNGTTKFSSTMGWYMGGVRVQHQTPQFNFYGQVLVGDVYSSNTVTMSGVSSSTSANAFGMKLGGGLDWIFSPHFGVRLGQINYDLSHFGGGIQNNFDYSAGLVVQFGGAKVKF